MLRVKTKFKNPFKVFIFKTAILAYSKVTKQLEFEFCYSGTYIYYKTTCTIVKLQKFEIGFVWVTFSNMIGTSKLATYLYIVESSAKLFGVQYPPWIMLNKPILLISCI